MSLEQRKRYYHLSDLSQPCFAIGAAQSEKLDTVFSKFFQMNKQEEETQIFGESVLSKIEPHIS